MARKPLISPGSILPTPAAPEPPSDLLSRVIANDRARRRPEPPPLEDRGENITSNITEHITPNITGNTAANTSQNILGSIPGKTSENITGHITNNITSNITSHMTDAPAPLVSRILSDVRSARDARPDPLRVVTLKVPPTLDDQIERHCLQYGRKKQEVIRDALLLYFEAFAQAEAQEGD